MWSAYRLLTERLTGLLDTVLADEVAGDRDTTERLVRLASAALSLNERHVINARGRCRVCRKAPGPWWHIWPRWSICSVYETLSLHLAQTSRPAQTCIEDRDIDPPHDEP